MIAIIGATGNVGRPLVQTLTAAGESVTAISRRGGPGPLHAVADLAHPPSLATPLAGAHAAFLVVGGSGAGLDPQAIISTIAAAGVRHITLLSSIGTRSRPHAASHEPLRQFEASLQRSTMSWTILHPGGFASNAFGWVPSVRAHRRVAAPFADVAIPVVDPDDIAAVATATLRAPAEHAMRTYTLTGPAPISPREQCDVLARVLDTPLAFTELAREQAAEIWSAFMPRDVIETTLDALGTPNALEREVSGDIERVLGRPAQPFAAWAARNADMFR